MSNAGEGTIQTHTNSNEKKNIVFMFSGLGAQYVNMGRELYHREPVFRQEMDCCFDIIKKLMGEDLKDVLYPDGVETDRMNHIEVAQPVVFAFEYALAKLVMNWGIKPRAMMGYSLGEYTAACISGVMSLEDALKLVAAKGELIRKVPPGIMLSVPLPAAEIQSFLNDDLSLSIDNGDSCIVSGPDRVFRALEAGLKKKKVLCMRIQAKWGGHSKMFEPILEEFARHVSEVTLNPPKVPFVSNITGTWIAVEEATDPNYWVRHLRETVRFADNIEEVTKDRNVLLVEIGPGRELSSMVLRYIDRNPNQQVVNLVRHREKDVTDTWYLLNKLGQLWLYGATIDWSGFHDFYGEEKEKLKRIPLPVYPFEGQRYWIDGQVSPMDAGELLKGKEEKGKGKDRWLVFRDEGGAGSRFIQRLKQENAEVITVSPGGQFKKDGTDHYIIDPSSEEDYDLLYHELETEGKLPEKVIDFAGEGEHGGDSGDSDISLLKSRPVLMNPYLEPRTGVERTLAGIWRGLFGFGKIGVRDDFFELGGDSLKAITVISRIHQSLNVEIPLQEFFHLLTIENLAAYIDTAEKGGYAGIGRVEKKEYYTVSSAQKRLYILQQMDRESTGYNETQVTLLEGRLDKEKLEKTFHQLIQRHESLRTSFILVADEPVQVVHDHVEFKIDFFGRGEPMCSPLNGNHTPINGNHTPLNGNHAPINGNNPGTHRGVPLQDFVRPFDLSQAPFMRAALIRRAEESHLLVMDTHHIVTDATSYGIFAGDFMSFYAGDEPAPLTIQYKDYAQWQTNEKGRESLKRQETFWLKQFEGEIPVLNLPLDYPRPAIQGFEGKHMEFTVSVEETAEVKAFALAEDVTLNMLLLSVFYILMAKLSGQEDIVVGSPVSGRRHVELESIIGVLVNTLALRNFPRSDLPFNTFVQEVKGRALDAYENQEYQFEDLVEQVVLTRDPARNPLFDTLFMLQGMEAVAADIPGLTMKPYEHDYSVSKFDMTLFGAEMGENLVFVFEYCTGLFKEETIQRFFHYFMKILTTVLEDPAKRIRDIEIISDREKEQLLLDFNDTKVPCPADKTVYRLFEEQAEKTPDNIAVKHLHTSVSYKELNTRSNRLASGLIEKGVGEDTIVAIMMERSEEMVVGIMGILKAGGAYLPIDANYPEERINYMLRDSGAEVLVNWLDGLVVGKLDGSSESTNKPINRRTNKPTNLAYIIYTSGSTGKPKGVLIE
ncbi:MAG: acyltransferase domain-containing protein, partial [bacterium]|nr:acyltransferase domain-containing protein [bacterium]